MDLLSLFQSGTKFERIKVKPVRNEIAVDNLMEVLPTLPVKENNTDYVEKYVNEENKRALESVQLTKSHGLKNDDVSVGTATTFTETERETTRIFNYYDFSYRPKVKLPIFDVKNDISQTIQTSPVTVIEGVTGCGKSTQVPQFILEDSWRTKQPCKIIVTQPRRLAAYSIAERVSKERDWPLGSIVGIQVGMYRKTSPDTMITYCTTGVLLRKLINAKNMLEFTHIVVDEVHEREQELDFLLLVIRKLLRSNSRHIKVVLMSATFNAEKFANYFAIPTDSGFMKAPIISISKKRIHSISIHYLCELGTLGTIPDVSKSQPGISDSMMEFCIKLINVFDDIDKKSDYEDYDCDDIKPFEKNKVRHSTLVFLPGIWEIEELHAKLSAKKNVSKWDILILHSSITNEEQSKIFTSPPEGYRRIILSTNIAESSITISNIKYIIDFCLTKMLVTDQTTNFQCLELSWASKANCEQRAGRAGRVMAGRVYRLIPKEFYNDLEDEARPEILRAPLENLVLKAKEFDMGEPKALLALAIDPPDLTNLERTILLLREAGALIGNPYNNSDGELTDLGRIMSNLPIEIHISKMVVLGHVFSILRDTIIIAACLALKNMFSNPFGKKMDAYKAKMHWADRSESDCIAFLNAFHLWQSAISNNNMRRNSEAEKKWCKRHFIQIKVIHEIDYLQHEITKRLEHLGIKESCGTNKIIPDDNYRFFILKFVIAGAFYPNYFVQSTHKGLATDETKGVRELGGLDPLKTVYLLGWKPEYPGVLYAKRIQEVFKDITPSYNQCLVTFDRSARVCVTFNEDDSITKKGEYSVTGKIPLTMYRALKMRKLNTSISIPVLDLKSSQKEAQKLGITTLNSSNLFFNKENFEAMKAQLPSILPNLPSFNENEIVIKVINFIDPSNFWVQIINDKNCQDLSIIENFLNNPHNLQNFKGKAEIGSVVISPLFVHERGLRFCRAIVESVRQVNGEDIIDAFFIDYGYYKAIRVADLKIMKKSHPVAKMPATAIKCTITGIQPSKRHKKNDWSREACSLFMDVTGNSYKCIGKIFSIVDSLISLELVCYIKNQEGIKKINLKELLIAKQLAESAEESFISRYNNTLRSRFIEYESPLHQKYIENLQYDRKYFKNFYPESPNVKECNYQIDLRGPISPLEISISSLAISASGKKINIEQNSVNSVLLDCDPDDVRERLLVSTSVSQNSTGSNLCLRNTTVMPNIHGLTALVCLVFAPKIELRRSVRGTHYIGALCGLGYDEKTGYPLLPEHDMEVHFDTEFNVEEIAKINGLRHYMNMGIFINKESSNSDYDKTMKCQSKVHEFASALIDTIRRSQPCQMFEDVPNFKSWALYDDSLLLEPEGVITSENCVFPLHYALQLELRNQEQEKLALHVEQLRALAASDVKSPQFLEVFCELCKQSIIGAEALRIHLFMDEHKQREKEQGIGRREFG